LVAFDRTDMSREARKTNNMAGSAGNRWVSAVVDVGRDSGDAECRVSNGEERVGNLKRAQTPCLASFLDCRMVQTVILEGRIRVLRDEIR